MVFAAPIHNIERTGTPAFDDAGAIEHLGNQRVPRARLVRLRKRSVVKSKWNLPGLLISQYRHGLYISPDEFTPVCLLIDYLLQRT